MTDTESKAREQIEKMKQIATRVSENHLDAEKRSFYFGKKNYLDDVFGAILIAISKGEILGVGVCEGCRSIKTGYMELFNPSALANEIFQDFEKDKPRHHPESIMGLADAHGEHRVNHWIYQVCCAALIKLEERERSKVDE